jgi:hypothetical protein
MIGWFGATIYLAGIFALGAEPGGCQQRHHRRDRLHLRHFQYSERDSQRTKGLEVCVLRQMSVRRLRI